MKKYAITLLLINCAFSALLNPEDGVTLNQIHVMFEWEQESENDFYIFWENNYLCRGSKTS